MPEPRNAEAWLAAEEPWDGSGGEDMSEPMTILERLAIPDSQILAERLAFNLDLAPLSNLIGEVLDPNAGDGFSVPFTGWINNEPHQVLCVLDRTVVYQCDADRKVATFAAVMVQPADIVRRYPRKRSYGRLVSLTERTCLGCGAPYVPLAASQLYHSEGCRLLHYYRAPRPKKVRPERTCPQCQRAYIPRKDSQVYCSRHCQATAVGKLGHHPQVPTHPNVCVVCGADFLGKRRAQLYCSRTCNDTSVAQRRKEERRWNNAARTERRRVTNWSKHGKISGEVKP